METKTFFFAKVAQLDRPGIINLNLSIYKNSRGTFTLSIEGDAKNHYIAAAGLQDSAVLRFETLEEAMQAAKEIVELAEQDGYFQTVVELNNFDMNALMMYKDREDVKSILLYNINH